MIDLFHPSAYAVEKTGVTLTTDDPALAELWREGERICIENRDTFGGLPILREGAKYNGVWLETQPMGGEMYASRDASVALANHLIFMKYQRRDGKMPGMISCSYPWRGVTPHHDWMQGDFFSRSALRMYYLIGKDRRYLTLLYTALRDFDSYLWNYRDTDGDGCLETFCVWDTGDDNNTKLLSRGVSAHENGAARGEGAPVGFGDLPFESAEYMAYSYSQRSVLATVSDLLGNGEGDLWRARAEEVRRRFAEYLWDSERGAAYDRDRNNRPIYVLTLENLKCMYHGILTQEMADEFVARHLMNPEEFYTPLPLPNIAANDPCFCLDEVRNNFTPKIRAAVDANKAGDMGDNSWGGPVQGLCHQRAIDALIGYGHHAELTLIARRWVANLCREKIFTQQYDPFSGEHSEGVNGYGPTILSALEDVTHLLGVDYAADRFTFSNGAKEADSVFTQHLFGSDYTLTRKGGLATVTVDGKTAFTFTGGVRVICDAALSPLLLVGMESEAQTVSLTKDGVTYTATVAPNEEYVLCDSALVLSRRVPFCG
ncbi:MAG: hypothetical protein J6T24_04820 [Clostridia bacterium]|nr:hypothetical protein [Clostridia bacterium]